MTFPTSTLIVINFTSIILNKFFSSTFRITSDQRIDCRFNHLAVMHGTNMTNVRRVNAGHGTAYDPRYCLHSMDAARGWKGGRVTEGTRNMFYGLRDLLVSSAYTSQFMRGDSCQESRFISYCDRYQKIKHFLRVLAGMVIKLKLVIKLWTYRNKSAFSW